MIKPAKDYELQIAIESIWAADDPDNKFLYFNSKGHVIYLINNESKAHEFAIVDNDDELIGFVRYGIKNNEAYNLEAINFNRKQQSRFGVDLIKICTNIFDKYNFNKLSFSAFKQHPALDKYKQLVSHYNGTWKEKDDFVFFVITKQQYDNSK